MSKGEGNLTCREAGRRGGAIIKARLGREGYQKLGKLGGTATKERYGSSHYSEIGSLGGQRTLATRGTEFFGEIGRKGGAAVKRLIEIGRALEEKGASA